MTRLRGLALICLAFLLLLPLLTGCNEAEDAAPYEKAHQHVYGDWYDAAPAEEGAPITEQVRYCKICRDEQTRAKE